MMQMNEIQQRFSDVRRAVDHATQACRTQQGIPEDLRECLQQLDQQTSQAQQVFQSQDENQIRQCIDDLEQLSDRGSRRWKARAPSTATCAMRSTRRIASCRT